MELLLPKEVLAILKSVPNFTQSQICSGINGNLEGASKWTQTEVDGGINCLSSKPFANLDELISVTNQAVSSASFDRLEITGGHFYYDLSATVGSSFTPDANLPFGVEAWWIVEMPGNVVSTNADVKSGHTLKWNLLTAKGATNFTAESTIGSTILGIDSTLAVLGTLCALACCCVVLLIAGVLVFVLIRRRNAAAGTPAASPTPGG
jgi:hypothetical protein